MQWLRKWSEIIRDVPQEMLTLPYLPRLQEIRSVLEMVLGSRGFPKDFCIDAAKIVSKELDLDLVRGYKVHEDQSEEAHAWNYDSERRLYVDLTYDQFGNFPPVLVFKSLKRYRLVENDYLYLEYDAGCVGEVWSILQGFG